MIGSAPRLGNRDQSRREARQRLERFASEFFVDEHPEFRWLGVGRIDREGLREIAEELLAACQKDLRRLTSPVEPRLAKELARDRFWAISALIYDLGSDKDAKETQLRITGGAPLAICMGDVYRIGPRNLHAVQTTQGTFQISVKGCRAIFPDVVRTEGGKMWPGLCPACRNPRKKPTRDQSRALRSRLDSVFAGKTATIYEYSVTTFPASESSSASEPS